MNEKLAKALFESTLARDLPGMADIDSSLLLFAREIKKNFTVGVSGECADELFAGYPWYHDREALYGNSFPWATSTGVRKRLFRSDLTQDIDEYIKTRYDDTVSLAGRVDGESVEDKKMREMFLLNFYWFMQTLLDRKDRMTMFCGLEVRLRPQHCGIRYNILSQRLYGREGILREEAICFRVVFRKSHIRKLTTAYFKLVKETQRYISGTKLISTYQTEMSLRKSKIDTLNSRYGQLMGVPRCRLILCRRNISCITA